MLIRNSRFALPFILFLIHACSGAESVPCQTDRNCPEYFHCDQAGVCVQRVIACGEDFCPTPQQDCIDQRCQNVSAAGGAGGGIPPDALIPTDIGTGGSGGSIVDMGERPDMHPPAPPPVVTIDTPMAGQTIIDDDVLLTGHIEMLEPDAIIQLQIDDTPPTPLPVDMEGAFTNPLRLDPGHHILVVSAEQAGERGEARVELRSDAFVTVAPGGGGLQMQGQPFRFVGLDAPDLLEYAHIFLRDGGDDPVDEIFREAHALGCTVVRTQGYNDDPNSPSVLQLGRGNYNEAGLAALDHVIAQAGHYGIKLWLPLIGTHPEHNSVDQYLRWSAFPEPTPADRLLFFNPGQVRAHAMLHLRTLLARTNSITGLRYVDDPAVMTWAVLDGSAFPGTFMVPDGAGLNNFLEEATGELATSAPQQLIVTGEAGYDINPAPYGAAIEPLAQANLGLFSGEYGAAWRRNLSLPAVSIATVHIHPALFGFPATPNELANFGAAWLSGHALVAVDANKPLVVSSARVDVPGLQLAGQRVVMQAWFDEVISRGMIGFIPGRFYPDSAFDAATPGAWHWQNGTDANDPANVYADLVRMFVTDWP